MFVEYLAFCLFRVGNMTGRGSLPHDRKLLLPLLQGGVIQQVEYRSLENCLKLKDGHFRPFLNGSIFFATKTLFLRVQVFSDNGR